MQSRRGRPVPHTPKTIRAPPTHTDLRACGQVLSYAWHSRASHCPSFGVRPPAHLLPHLFFPIRVDFRCSRRSHRPVRRSAPTPPPVLSEKNLQAEERIRAVLPHGCGARRAPDLGPVSTSASTSATVPTSPFAVLAWPNSWDVRCVGEDEWRGVLVLVDHRACGAAPVLARCGQACDPGL